MKSMIIVALALVAVAVAIPVDDKEAEVVEQNYELYPDGSYKRSSETNNGIRQNEEGQLKEVLNEDNKPQQVVVVRGGYEYTSPDGTPVNVKYFADETGYHPEGDVVPKAARR